MFPELRSINRVTRAVLSITATASLILSSHSAAAQPTSRGPDAVQSAAPNRPARISQAILDRLGIQRPSDTNLTELSQQIAKQVRANGLPASSKASQRPDAGGLPSNFNVRSALSAAVMTTLNSSNGSNFRDVLLMADADGREDLVADHSAKIDDKSNSGLPSGWTLTRAALSEHTFSTGYTSTVYYYGDSVGNVYVGADTTGNPYGSNVLTYTVLNLPTILNAFGTLNSDDQIVITGLGVNPVADLSSFPHVNGSFSFFNGKIGEILYVAYWDTGAGLRLTFNNQLVRSGVLAFPIADDTSPALAPPGIQSAQDFPVTVGGAFGVDFSLFSNVAGLAVDDDGSVYFQQVDLIGFTGANIVKITSVDKPGVGGNQDRSLATNGFATLTTLNPFNGNYQTSSGPANQVNRVTNFSGTSPTFGNIVALAAGPNNILYAAMARSFVPTDAADVQATEGLFTNPPELGPTPSMVISFADTSGAFDTCSAPLATITGTLPIADGFADGAQAGIPVLAGVDNFRAFVLGNGPDVRGILVGSNVYNTLQLDMQVDYTIYSGLAVDEESKVYVISGGTPAGVGLNPSPGRGEILVFPDQRTFDRRADFIDLRGDVPPNPPLSGGNVGDGQSDRYDHIFYQAPIDQLSLTPVGLSGLARGFLVYLNRGRGEVSPFTNLPNGQTLGNDDHSGPLFFEEFDPGHQIAGGDDQNPPFRGDDDDGAGLPNPTLARLAQSIGTPSLVGPLMGGFEFIYREFVTPTRTLQRSVWNGFYWNSNGSLTFGGADDANVPDVSSFLTGLPKVAGAWADLNPGSNWQDGYLNTFPVQALGFANINHFVVRWINVPSAGYEGCNSSNTFTISLYDDGTGIDENANQPLNPANPIGNNAVPFDLQEGPTDLWYVSIPTTTTLKGFSPRPNGSGNICVTYGRMDLPGTATTQTEVLVGATPGNLAWASATEMNLSEAARANDLPFPSPLGLAMGTVFQRATPYELFNLGVPASYTVTGGITVTHPATPTFDLRQEGNDSILSTPINQPDLNRGQVCFYILDYGVLLPLVSR